MLVAVIGKRSTGNPGALHRTGLQSLNAVRSVNCDMMQAL